MDHASGTWRDKEQEPHPAIIHGTLALGNLLLGSKITSELEARKAQAEIDQAVNANRASLGSSIILGKLVGQLVIPSLIRKA